MAAITDLTWIQLLSGLDELGLGHLLDTSRANSLSDEVGIYHLRIDLKRIPNWQGKTLQDEGVIWFVSKLLDACRRAQETANINQAAGERLNAFPNPNTGGVTNNFAPVTRSVIARHDLSSSQNIIGANI